MKKSLRERLRFAVEIVRWRGLLAFLLLALREVLSLIMYWHVFHIFETDIERPPTPYSKRIFDVRIYTGGKDLERAKAEIAPMGAMTAAQIASRFNDGQAVAVAYAEEKAVGYSWISFSSGPELVFGTRWIVQSDEAVFDRSFTRPQWRGLGVHSCLDAAMSRYARQHGRLRILGSVSALNGPSLSLVKHSGKPKIMTLILIRVRGTNWVYRKAIGAPLESRFSVSSDSRDVQDSVATSSLAHAHSTPRNDGPATAGSELTNSGAEIQSDNRIVPS